MRQASNISEANALIKQLDDRIFRLEKIAKRKGVSAEDLSSLASEPVNRSESGNDYDYGTFGVCIERDLVLGTYLPPAKMIPAAKVAPYKTYAYVKVAATGADVKCSLWKGTKFQDIVIPAGSIVPIANSTYTVNEFSEMDLITLDVDQIGSTTPGQTLIVVVKFKVISWV